MKKIVKVAAIQMEIKPLDISVNLKRAEAFMAQIFANNKVDLIVFPEDFITGPIPNNLELVQDEHSDSIKFFKNLALKYQTYIVCGSVIKEIDKKYYNTALLISKAGETILEYQKNNLWLPERRYLTSGNEAKIVRTPIGNIGIIICWDLAFPEISRELTRKGADIICCPSYWTLEDGRALHKKYGLLTEKTFINALCPARAIENEVLFIYANGAKKAEAFLKSKKWAAEQIGQTQICAPILGTVAKINSNREGFIVYEYNRQLALDAEKNYKLREDLNLKYHSPVYGK